MMDGIREVHRPSTRLDELTALRGIAALWVVFLHASYEWNSVFRTGERYTSLVSGAGLWVHFFFVLSGFVIAHAYTKDFSHSVSASAYRRFLWVRFGRIYPLYFVVLLAWILFVSAGWIAVRNPPGSLPASFFLLQGFFFGDDVWNYPGWSISAEWLAYCAFPFIAVALVRLDDRKIRMLLLALSVGIVALWGCGPGISEHPSVSAAYCLLEFSLGCVVHRTARGNAWPRFGPRTGACIGIAPIVLLALPPSIHSGWLLGIATVCCASTIGIVASQATSLDPILRSRILGFLGTISYSVYLVHALLFRVVRAVIDGLTGQSRVIANLPAGSALAAFAGYVAVLLVVSWLTYITIEEPGRKWFKRTPPMSGAQVGLGTP